MDVARVNGAINEVSSFCGLALRDNQGLETAAAAYPMLTQAKRGHSQKSEICLLLLAHPTRFERVTFAFGGQPAPKGRPSKISIMIGCGDS